MATTQRKPKDRLKKKRLEAKMSWTPPKKSLDEGRFYPTKNLQHVLFFFWPVVTQAQEKLLWLSGPWLFQPL